jgi:hypothetical protein
MARSLTLNVRVTGPLSEFVSAKVGDNGVYENVSGRPTSGAAFGAGAPLSSG